MTADLKPVARWAPLLAAALIAALGPVAPATAGEPRFIRRADGVMLVADGVVGAAIYLPNPQHAATERFMERNWNESAWDNLGTVSDVLVDETGQIIALIVDVGGFLGLGTRPVAIAYDAVAIRPGPEGEDSVRVIVDVSRADLEDAPRFDVRAVRHPHYGAQERQAWLTRLAREGFHPVDLDAVTTQDIAAAQVFDAEFAPVGPVTALLFDSDGAVDRAVVAIEEGGWFGADTHRIALPLDTVTVFRGEGEIRLYTEAVRADLEAMPAHRE